jgi:hypothetical protein
LQAVDKICGSKGVLTGLERQIETLHVGAMNKTLTPEAQRALAEAEARRKAATAKPLPKEVAGGQGPEPTRFGDWEKKGITSDF